MSAADIANRHLVSERFGGLMAAVPFSRPGDEPRSGSLRPTASSSSRCAGNVGYMVVKEQPVPLTVELPGRTNPFAVSRNPSAGFRHHSKAVVRGRLDRQTQGQPLYHRSRALSRRL